jgi:hypothetical protein
LVTQVAPQTKPGSSEIVILERKQIVLTEISFSIFSADSKGRCCNGGGSNGGGCKANYRK